MFDMKPVIIKKIFKNQPHYILTWSPLKKADKYQINRAVPAMSGVYELYKKTSQSFIGNPCVVRRFKKQYQGSYRPRYKNRS